MAEQTKQEPEVNSKLLIRSMFKKMADELRYKPSEALQYVPRITVYAPERKRTQDEIEREEIAKKYNL